mmetsp:Transcript_25696/g.62942  ORF Transcript_25696/g.62942 Transcript_25696/m.62942 type:complete len:117 (-) Transcript_25696:1525-1875(-)
MIWQERSKLSYFHACQSNATYKTYENHDGSNSINYCKMKACALISSWISSKLDESLQNSQHSCSILCGSWLGSNPILTCHLAAMRSSIMIFSSRELSSSPKESIVLDAILFPALYK